MIVIPAAKASIGKGEAKSDKAMAVAEPGAGGFKAEGNDRAGTKRRREAEDYSVEPS
jgi:hypothetical protein